MPTYLMEFVTGALGVVLIDLVLSGDNAMVIGMAARRLPPRQRTIAIVLGGVGAIALRILFAAGATFLLTIPLLGAIGGVLLVGIAWKLLYADDTGHDAQPTTTVFGALQTILLADVVMSLDNILAIAGVSHGSIELLAIGLVVSMPLVLMGSSVIAGLINRLPWLTKAGAGLLAWTGGGMILDDHILARVIPSVPALGVLIPLALVAAVVGPSLRSVPRDVVGVLSRDRRVLPGE